MRGNWQSYPEDLETAVVVVVAVIVVVVIVVFCCYFRPEVVCG